MSDGMDSFETNVRSGPESTRHASVPPHLRAVLVSADGEFLESVVRCIQEAGLPLHIALEITAPERPLHPEHLERIRACEPHVVLLDMADDPDGAIRAAAAIGTGSPGAGLVGVGPDLEPAHLLGAMRAGVMEYLPRPVETSHLADALVRVMRKRGWHDVAEGHRLGKLLSFFSPKGGAGSTSVMTNVGIELHRLTGLKTLLVDLDLELGEIASLLGVRPRFHFVDLIRNFHRMDADLLTSYIESHESGVHVLSAPFEPEIGEEVTGEQIARILAFLRNHYDYVLVDTSKSLAPPALAALQAADPIFLVTNMDVPSLRNMKRCLPLLDRVTAGDAGRLRLVVNRFNPKSLVRLRDLEDTLGLEVYHTLTNDYETVIQASSTGRPLVLEGGSRYAEELSALARSIAHGRGSKAVSKGSLVKRLLTPFRSKAARAPVPLRSSPVEASSHG
jgi:pilus assembly protein CpaE